MDNKKIKNKHQLFVLLCLFIVTIWTNNLMAQKTISLTLDESIDYAYKNNLKIQNFDFEQRQLDYDIKIQKSSWLPQVNILANYEDQFILPTTLLPGELAGQENSFPVETGAKYNLNAGIEINQTIYDPGLRSRQNLIERQSDLIGYEKQKTKEQLAYQVAQTYVFVQVIRKKLEFLRENENYVTDILQVSNALLKEGLIAAIDIDQLQLQKIEIDTEKKILELELDKQYNHLRYFLGLKPSTKFTLTDPLIIPEKLIKKTISINQHVDVISLNAKMEMKRLEQKITKAAYLPVTSVYFRYNQSYQSRILKPFDSSFWFDNGLIGLRVYAPIFRGMRKQHELSKNSIQIEQLKIQGQDTKAYLTVQYENAKKQLDTKYLMIEQLQDNIEVSEKIRNTKKAKYEEGYDSITDLLYANIALRQTQAAYTDAILQTQSAYLDLLRITGAFKRN